MKNITSEKNAFSKSKSWNNLGIVCGTVGFIYGVASIICGGVATMYAKKELDEVIKAQAEAFYEGDE